MIMSKGVTVLRCSCCTHTKLWLKIDEGTVVLLHTRATPTNPCERGGLTNPWLEISKGVVMREGGAMPRAGHCVAQWREGGSVVVRAVLPLLLCWRTGRARVWQGRASAAHVA